MALFLILVVLRFRVRVRVRVGVREEVIRDFSANELLIEEG